jgi:hypothetical protein
VQHSKQLTFLSLDHHARTCPLPGNGRDSRENEAGFSWRQCESLIKWLLKIVRESPFGKMSQEHCRATEEKTLVPSSGKWEAGGAGSLTGFWTFSSSALPNDADVSSLSDILEAGTVQRKYFLSPKACAGILRRAKKRGRALPRPLLEALEQAARTTTGHRVDFTLPQPSKAVPENEAGQPTTAHRSPLHVTAGTTQGGGIDVATCLNACKTSSGRIDFESETFVTHETGQGWWKQSDEEASYCLCNPASGGRTHSRQIITPQSQVRRLTPTECERLMGWPDGYTAWGLDDDGATVEMSDSARYRMIGNGVGAPVAEWMAKRIREGGNP